MDSIMAMPIGLPNRKSNVMSSKENAQAQCKHIIHGLLRCSSPTAVTCEADIVLGRHGHLCGNDAARQEA